MREVAIYMIVPKVTALPWRSFYRAMLIIELAIYPAKCLPSSIGRCVLDCPHVKPEGKDMKRWG